MQITADGIYSSERQQKLYHWCNIAGLNWDDARRFIRPESQAFLHRYVGEITKQRPITDEDIADIQRLQRRLGMDLALDTTPPTTRIEPQTFSWWPIVVAVIVVLIVVALVAWQWFLT